MSDSVQTFLNNVDLALQDNDISGKEDKTNKVITLDSSSTDTQYPSARIVYTKLRTKQDLLSFDDAPTSSSNNPVKSGGVYTALSGKQDTLNFDNTPTASSNNPVKSGGVYAALSGKQNNLNFDSIPTNGSTNPVTSDGVFDALSTKLDYVAGDTISVTDDAISAEFDNRVAYTAQTKTEEEKATARNNIGALSTSGGTVTGNLTINGDVTLSGLDNLNGVLYVENKVVKADGLTTENVEFANTYQAETTYITTNNTVDECLVNLDEAVVTKQDILVSGETIKKINNIDILGEGNIEIPSGEGVQVQSDWNEADSTSMAYIAHKPDLSEYATTAVLEEKYEKPSGGIPASDLTYAIQTSLNNADAALPASGGTITGNLTIDDNNDTTKGNLTVANNLSVGGDETIAGNLTINGLSNSSGVLRVASNNVFADDETYMTLGGSVDTYGDLPSSGISIGDTRYIRETGTLVVATSVTTDTKLYFGLTTPNISIEIDTANANTPVISEEDFYTGMAATEDTFSNYPTLSYIYFPYEQLNTGQHDLHLVPISSADYGIVLALVSSGSGQQKKAFALTTLLSYGEMNSWYKASLTNSGEFKNITSSIPPSSYNTCIKEFVVFGSGVQWSIIGETREEASVLYNITQTLTDDQKLNACSNIGAQSTKLVDDTWSYDDIVDALTEGYTLYRLDISGTTETYYHFSQKTDDKCTFVSLGYDSGFQILVKSIGNGADDTWTSNQYSLA